MQVAGLILLFIIVVIESVSPESENSEDTCPCSPTSDCPPIYQLFPGHSACFKKNKTVVKSGLSDDEKKEILRRHNEIRSNAVPMPVNMLKMTWDDELAMVSQRFTDTCVYNQQNRIAHDKARFIPGRFFVGQNLAWGYSSFAEAINAWYREHLVYNKKFGRDTSLMHARIGHYTQIVWHSTNKVGCGYSKCDRKVYYVCNYAPIGNIFPFKQPYKNGTKECEDCLKCTDRLCDCGDLECANGGTLDPKTCKCSCQHEPINSQPNCHVNCSVPDMSKCGKEAPYMSYQCSYASGACPHMCKICSCLAKTNKEGKCNSPRMASTLSEGLMLLSTVSESLMLLSIFMFQHIFLC